MQRGYRFKKNGSWYLRYRDNFSERGEIVRKQVCVKLAEVCDRYRRSSDLDELVDEKLAGVRQAAKCTQSCESFVNFVEASYLPWCRENKKPSTYTGYRTHFNLYLKPRTAHFALRDFTVKIVCDLLADIAAAHPLNVESLGKIHSILSGIFTYAIATGAFPARSRVDNPCAGALLPKAAPKTETAVPTFETVRATLSCLNKEGLTLAYGAVALVAYTGIRPGEAKGLEWGDWNRQSEQLHIRRSIWHGYETSPKTMRSIRFVTVTPELRAVLLGLWNAEGCPISGPILAHANCRRLRLNLDNLSKRVITPALKRCAVCHGSELRHRADHPFQRDQQASIPWFGFYALRRFHATQVRAVASSDTASKALGNSAQVCDKHYIKPAKVFADVRAAVTVAMEGLTA